MIYNANNQNDDSRWTPSTEESASAGTAWQTHKKTILVLGGIALLLLSILFWIGVANFFGDDEPVNNGSSSGSSYTVEDEYMDIMYDKGGFHTFATDADAIQFGYNFCSSMDEFYIEDVAEALEQNNSGILRGVSLNTKVAASYAAVNTLCTEHYAELKAYAN